MSNMIVFAPAGAKKTAYIIDKALGYKGNKKVLLLTYTNENLLQLKARLRKAQNGIMPQNIVVMSWYQFLLRDCIKPYQNFLTDTGRVKSINFHSSKPFWAKKENINLFFIDSNSDIYSDTASDFACQLNKASDGRVIHRISEIYEEIYIDEMQDLAGYDLDLLALIFNIPTQTILVGDPRQTTFRTNYSLRNKKYVGMGFFDWAAAMKKVGLSEVETKNQSYRCNQAICDFADKLYVQLPPTISKNLVETGHDGIFKISRDEVPGYMKKYRPIVLRHDRRTNTEKLAALNFGLSKGSTYDRVLIFPTAKMREYLNTEDVSLLKDLTKSKFYVAVTRAKYSVAFVA